MTATCAALRRSQEKILPHMSERVPPLPVPPFLPTELGHPCLFETMTSEPRRHNMLRSGLRWVIPEQRLEHPTELVQFTAGRTARRWLLLRKPCQRVEVKSRDLLSPCTSLASVN